MKILLATPDSDLRLAIELYLIEEPGVCIIGTASDAGSLLALHKNTHPDLVFLDWDLPGKPISRVIDELLTCCDKNKIIVLGKKMQIKEKALSAGANDFVLRGDPPERFINSFRKVRFNASTTQ